MDSDGKKQIGIGRGCMLLKLIKEKNEAEAKAAAAATAAATATATAAGAATAKTTETVAVQSLSMASSIPKSSIVTSAITKVTPETVTPEPVPISGQGRGTFILSRIKSISSNRQTLEQPCIPEPPSDDAGMLSKLSDITIQDTTHMSRLSYQRNEQISQQSTKGKPIQLSANYINLKVLDGKGMFNYEIKFNPDIESRSLRLKLLNQHIEILGRTKVFDGVILYLPHKLKDNITIYRSLHPMDGSTVTLTLVYKKEQTVTKNILFFNILLGRVMRALSLVRIGRQNFNPKGIYSIPQHKLEVWPGYVTAINEYKGGLKLCIDARHRVMRTETVLDIMISYGNKSNFKDKIMRELIELSVFTRYNNKTYRIDDIAWDRNPTYTFDKGGEKISLIDYYKLHWNLDIRDTKQPLLVNRAKTRLPNGGIEETIILLVPELCYVASLTDTMRSDFKMMKDLDIITKITPTDRHAVYRYFIEEVNNNEIPRNILADWGLQLETDIIDFTGRLLEPEKIVFGNNKTFTPPSQKPAEWSYALCRNIMLRTPHLNHWCILYCEKDTRCTQEFIIMLKNVSKTMGMFVNEPHKICLKDDRIETYIKALRTNIQKTVNLMVIVFSTNRTDKYSVVKRMCCVEMPIPSQVILSKTISRGDKLKNVTERIALQINCKLGGALWVLTIPMENCMICGIDVYHAGAGQSTKGSVAGFVASLDRLLTTWHSKICLQGRHQELIDMLQFCLLSAIKAYYKHNKRYPDRIIVYRDGVGQGQIQTVINYEVKQMLATFKNIESSYQPALTVIIVHKRIDTRLFAKTSMGLDNPPPGTIVDSDITTPELYNFFLVSQNVRHGTVSPTHYIVAYDSKNMKVEHLQKLTYKLCHLYYNWPGTIKVPAPCQYAHKLVSLVGQNIQLEPHKSLSDTLYYL